MQTAKANLVWRLLLFLIFLRPFICQRCYPRFDIYYCLIFLFCALLWSIFSPKVSFKKIASPNVAFFSDKFFGVPKNFLRRLFIRDRNNLNVQFSSSATRRTRTILTKRRISQWYRLYTFLYHKSHLHYPLLLLVIALGLSTLFSINPRLSLSQIYKFIPYFVAFYLMGQITPGQKKQVLVILISAGFLLGLYGIYQFFWGFQNILDYLSRTEPYLYAEEFLARKRVFATFFSPDMFAGYLIMIIPLAVGLFLDSITKKKRPLCLLIGFSISFMFISLLLTKSLGAWISLFVAFLIFAILLFVYYPFLRPKILLATGIVCVIIIPILAGIFIIRADHLLDFGSPQNSIIQRLYFWKSATKIIRDFPFTGVGLGNFGLIYPRYKSLQAIETHFAHNSYLQIWAELGILGIIGWFWLILTSFRVGLRKLKAFKGQDYLMVGLLAASSSFLFHNLIDFDFFIPEVTFQWWVILGLQYNK